MAKRQAKQKLPSLGQRLPIILTDVFWLSLIAIGALQIIGDVAGVDLTPASYASFIALSMILVSAGYPKRVARGGGRMITFN